MKRSTVILAVVRAVVTAVVLGLPVLATAQNSSPACALCIPEEVVSAFRQNPAAAPPLFVESLRAVRERVDAWLADGVLVPEPRDMAGGYSHEVHKRNFLRMQEAGALYELTGEERYGAFLRELFLAYAEAFPRFGGHPATKSYAPGKLFWQALNDANWLVYGSQAYASVRASLSPEERTRVEGDFLRPYADFVSLERPQFFNRVHNHSTWGNAAVGMLAIALDDETLLRRALYGLPPEYTTQLARDNDGGDIEAGPDGEAGFFAQLDNAFSPDGYYSEGPYYQRYAMLPFVVFAKALQRYRPELGIFAYRDSLLGKAVHALTSLTDGGGAFYPINDAQKGMSIRSRELVAAVDALYYYGGREEALLTTAQRQGRVVLDHTGYAVTEALAGRTLPLPPLRSALLRDGRDGTGGGVATLRSAPRSGGELNAVFKFGTQGMGHGHFDRLGLALYAGATELMQDYGAARWVNIDQKAGGRYLPENQTYAKQTLAHNTVVLGRRSQFGGSTRAGEAQPSELYFFDAEAPGRTAASAKDRHAYPGTELHRTLVLLEDTTLGHPLLIDVFRVRSETAQSADLPVHFAAQLLSSSVPLDATLDGFRVLGDSAGYQHVVREAAGRIDSSAYAVSWFADQRFCTQVHTASRGDSLIFARVGANDPNFNLRRDAFYLQRKAPARRHLFASVTAAHGHYSPVSEIPVGAYAKTIQPAILLDGDAYTALAVDVGETHAWRLLIANEGADATARHEVTLGGETVAWTGPYHLQRLPQ